ncbi:MAG: hypothetical protein IPH84_02100 [Bacteroidales bacterium]|nr:hypothetical protein [Bacteroidales bacterium]
MKTILLLIASTFCISILTGCNTLIKLAVGIKNPKLETEESISEFLDKLNVPNEKIFVCIKVFYDCETWVRGERCAIIPYKKEVHAGDSLLLN